MTWTARTMSWILLILAITPAPSETADAKSGQLGSPNDKVQAKTTELRYAPDRKVDILHITIDVTPDFKSHTVAGTTTIKFAPIAKPLTELRLDAIELDVSSVTSSAEIASHSATDETIIITFEPPIEPDVESSVTIAYEAEPKRGLYFRTPDMGYRREDMHLWTQGEPHYAPNWYPNYDYPNERSTSEVICRVPKDMTVLSNGRLVSEKTDPKSGLKTVHWLQDKPHVNYLIALAAGKFKSIQSQYKNIPLAFYTPTSQIDQAQNSFKDTADMMAFFESEIGVAYPWNKYHQVVVDDFLGGGMENTTLTILTDRTLFTSDSENILSSQMLVSHELVHQWFGNYITCKDWSHIWLNEGFATYYALLYDEYKDGRDHMMYGLYRNAHNVLSEQPGHKPIFYRSYENPWEQFDHRRTYHKGAWIVHMLRSQLGEKLYRQCIKTYLERYALSSVVTENLNSVIEELSGRSFDRFLDQWVYHARHPDLTVSYNWSQKNKLAKVSVEQTHTPSGEVMLFHFPAKVRFAVDGRYVDEDIVIDSKKHDFYFPLQAEPNIIRFDPQYSVLANISFKKSKAMLYEQLDDKTDVIGRLLAVEALKEKKDKKTVARLKDVLNNDPFYGVRVEASLALLDIHTDEAFDALAESLEQPDARVRQQVTKDIGQFYRPESLELTKQILKTEKNPEILIKAIRNLGLYHSKDTQRLLNDYLKSKSYRNKLACAAVKAIRMLDETAFIAPLKTTLTEYEQRFTSHCFARSLDTLAHITRNEDDKTQVREFLASYVNHPKERIKAGAIEALGTLADDKAIPLIKTFVGDDPDDRVEQAAKQALEKLREKKKLVPDEIIQLREAVDELKKDNKSLKDDVEDIKKQLDAKEKTEENESDDKPSDPNKTG